MNIFYLDEDPVLAARYHCNRRVIKMILETAQILCTVRWNKGEEAPYKPTHHRHPCVIWAGYSRENYEWLCRLGVALADEYSSRYHGRVHKSLAVIFNCMENPPDSWYVEGFTTPPLAMPDKYKQESPVESYRSYWVGEKLDNATYPDGLYPDWIDQYLRRRIL